MSSVIFLCSQNLLYFSLSYFLLRFEDLVSDPAYWLDKLYIDLNMESGKVERSELERHVRPGKFQGAQDKYYSTIRSVGSRNKTIAARTVAIPSL